VLVPPGGCCILALADNTLALSWLQHSSGTKHLPVRHLARFLIWFLSSAFPAPHVRVQSKHIPWIKNNEANLFSRFGCTPSWESIISHSLILAPLPMCQLLCNILCSLAYLVSNEPTKAWFDNAMIELWTTKLPPFMTDSFRLQGAQMSLLPA